MKRPRHYRSNWVDALPGDWPENQPKVYLYRIDAQHRWRYLDVFPARYFDLAFVKSQFGGGEYWY